MQTSVAHEQVSLHPIEARKISLNELPSWSPGCQAYWTPAVVGTNP